MPHVAPVPTQKFVEVERVRRAPDDRRVEDLKAVFKRGLGVGDTKGHIEFGHGTDAEDVKDGENDQPKGPGAPATPRFGRFHGGGCALVCGGLWHEGNVKQRQKVLKKETK